MISQRMKSLLHLADLRNTTDLADIEEAVYSDNLTKVQYVAMNSLLTTEQCRYLFPRLNDKILSLSQPNFPSDLMHDIALDENDPFILELILAHPNIAEETQVALTLMDKP